MNPEVEARKITELVNGGMSVEEAVRIVLEEVKKRSIITDRVEWIKGLDTVAEVRRALRSAHGKKSKARTEEKVAKYQKEVDTANQRLNQLLNEAYEAGDPIKTMIELGEDPKKVLHYWIRSKEEELKDQLGGLDLSKNRIKALVAEQKSDTPRVIVEELMKVHKDLPELYENRVGRGDQGVIAINRKVRLLAK